MSRLLAAAGSVIDRIKINSLHREVRAGRAVWVKRRRAAAGPVLALANRFFRAAGNPVRTLENAPAWQRWEVECFRQLHGGAFAADAEEPQTVIADELPGSSLSRHLEAGTLTGPMLEAAGHELRRAHQWNCAELGGAWSHGDPHTGNFVYDPSTGRARLIDFEVMHLRALPAEERHADDLLVFLQDLVGRIGTDAWLPCALRFLEGYGRPEIAARLKARLVVPGGRMAQLWWWIRTTYLSRAELARHLGALNAALPDF